MDCERNERAGDEKTGRGRERGLVNGMGREIRRKEVRTQKYLCTYTEKEENKMDRERNRNKERRVGVKRVKKDVRLRGKGEEMRKEGEGRMRKEEFSAKYGVFGLRSAAAM